MNETVYPKFLAYFEKFIKDNQAKSNSKFTVGDKVRTQDSILLKKNIFSYFLSGGELRLTIYQIKR